MTSANDAVLSSESSIPARDRSADQDDTAGDVEADEDNDDKSEGNDGDDATAEVVAMARMATAISAMRIDGFGTGSASDGYKDDEDMLI